MAWMMDMFSVATGHSVLGTVTGKPVTLGGSQGRAEATSRAVVHVALAALRHKGIDSFGATAAVQILARPGGEPPAPSPRWCLLPCRKRRARCRLVSQ